MPRVNLVEVILQVCRADPVVAGGGPVLVAVSGGPDSAALLHALSRAAPALRLQLTAAHLDHGLRRGSRTDASKVAALSERLEIPLISGRVELGKARSEDSARRARYRFLEEAAARAGTATIALGHTADDQAETVLLHLIRGSGLEGLAAMSVREGLRFRPLLRSWRAETVAYCRRHRLAPVQDPTNRSRRFARNRVRLDLLPTLEGYNPKVKASLVRLAETARAEHDVVAALAESWLARHRRRLSRKSLALEPAAVQVEAVRRAWRAAANGDELPGSAARLGQGVRLVVDGGSKGMLELGEGLQLHVDGDLFYIAREPR
jgi:tRNA(Ile)-lysidine synthase